MDTYCIVVSSQCTTTVLPMLAGRAVFGATKKGHLFWQAWGLCFCKERAGFWARNRLLFWQRKYLALVRNPCCI